MGLSVRGAAAACRELFERFAEGMSAAAELFEEQQARKLANLKSSIGFASSAAHGSSSWRQVSQTQLAQSPRPYLAHRLSPPPQVRLDPASTFVSCQATGERWRPHMILGQVEQVKYNPHKVNIKLGSEAGATGERFDTVSKEVGASVRLAEPPPPDLLSSLDRPRDGTLDGPHAASQTEKHLLPVHDPYLPKNRDAARSYQSYRMIRDDKLARRVSAYHPDQKHQEPATTQMEYGWGVAEQYRIASPKYAPGALWAGRKAGDISKFSQRMLLGAHHHLSGPMTQPGFYP